MRILIHDFGGYAFPLQLSRQLVERGHEVCHAYCASLTTTPPGVAPSDSDFALKGLHTAKPFDKYNFVRRWQQEHEYGRLIREVCAEFEPDIVLSGNAPLPAQQMLIKLRRQRGFRSFCRRSRTRKTSSRWGTGSWSAGPATSYSNASIASAAHEVPAIRLGRLLRLRAANVCAPGLVKCRDL